MLPLPPRFDPENRLSTGTRGDRLAEPDGLPPRPRLSEGLLGVVHHPPEADWRWEEASRRRGSPSPPKTRGQILIHLWRHAHLFQIKMIALLPPERAAVRSRAVVENRPFQCRPPMGGTSLHGEFCGGAGRQGVPQLYSGGPTADCTSPNAVLWGMETQLCINGMDGQDAETGLFTQVLQHPSSVHRHKRGKSIIPRQAVSAMRVFAA